MRTFNAVFNITECVRGKGAHNMLRLIIFNWYHGKRTIIIDTAGPSTVRYLLIASMLHNRSSAFRIKHRSTEKNNVPELH